MPKTFKPRPYSRVARDMWGDERFKALTPMKPSGQALWIYLLTGPHSTVIPGLVPEMGFGTLVDRLKWSMADVRKHWKEIADQQMAEADWNEGVIWLPNGFMHNEPANPNVVTAWRNVALPQCDLVRRALVVLRLRLWPLERARVADLTKKGKDPRESKGWVEAFDEVFGKGFPESIIAGYPKPLGDTETEAETEAEDSPPTPSSRGLQVSLRKPTSAERKRAEDFLRAMGSRACDHDPRCGSHDVCVGRLIYTWRHNTLVGMLDEAAS